MVSMGGRIVKYGMELLKGSTWYEEKSGRI